MAKLNEVYSEKQFKSFPPVMICNIEKEQVGNKKIYSRNFPIGEHHTNTIGFRSSFKVCKNYKNMMPGTAAKNSLQSKYSKNVDIESTFRKVETKQYPKNKRNILIDGDNNITQCLYNLKPVCNYKE